MQPTLEAAKHAFVNKEYEKAKQIMIGIINSNKYEDNQNSYKLYSKLGDICIALEQYQDAHKHYQQSLDKHPSNTNTLIKMGNLYQYHLNNQQESKLMYEKCLKIDPKQDQCLFNNANLMEHQNNHQHAKKLYLKCLIINNKTACVHYRLAKLLMKEDNSKEHTNIKKLLQKACNLQPSNDRYQQELVLYLERTNTKPNTNTNTNIRSNTNLQRMDPKYHANIKLVIYEFESIITYSNLNERIHGNLEKLRDFRATEIIRIFGGDSRVQRLKGHFDTILKKNVKIIILSFTSSDIIFRVLNRLNLDHYFNIIIGSDTSSALSATQSKIDDVIKLKHDNQIFNKKEVLFIDNDINQINNVSNECITYFIDNSKSKPLFGPAPDDFHHIECIVHKRKYHPPNIRKYDPKTSLNSINPDLCTNFFRDIINVYISIHSFRSNYSSALNEIMICIVKIQSQLHAMIHLSVRFNHFCHF